MLTRSAILARDRRRLRHLLKELASNTRCALAACLACRLILMLACRTILAFVRPNDITKPTGGTGRLGSTAVANESGRARHTNAIGQCAVVDRA